MRMWRKMTSDLRTGDNIELFVAILITIILIVLDVSNIDYQNLVNPSSVVLGVLCLIAIFHLRNRYFMESVLQQLKIKNMGIVNIYNEFPELEFKKLIRNAKTIKILQTWTPSYIYDWQEDISYAIKENNASLEVLLLDPSNIASKRGKEQKESNLDDYGPKQIKDTISHLDSIVQECSTKSNKISIKLYKKLPSIAAYICDDKVFIGFFLKRRKAIKSPFIEVQGYDCILRQMVDKEFQEMSM